MGTTNLFFFFFYSWLHQHSATMLGHLTQFKYLTREPVYQEQALTLVKVFPAGSERPFSICCSSHTDWNDPQTESQGHGSKIFYAGSQVTGLKTRNPSRNRRKQQHAKNNNPLSISPLRKRIWITSHKERRGRFGRGMRPFWGRHGMKLNK